jgi:hypothetical protein
LFDPFGYLSSLRPPFFESPCLYVTVFRIEISTSSCLYTIYVFTPTTGKNRFTVNTIADGDTKTTNLFSNASVSPRLWVPTCPSGVYLHAFGEQTDKQLLFLIDEATGRAPPVVSSAYRDHVPKIHQQIPHDNASYDDVYRTRRSISLSSLHQFSFMFKPLTPHVHVFGGPAPSQCQINTHYVREPHLWSHIYLRAS